MYKELHKIMPLFPKGVGIAHETVNLLFEATFSNSRHITH